MATKPRTLLVFSQPEAGQLNVILSIVQEIAKDSSIQIHLASFQEAKSRVDAINQRNQTIAHPIIFHLLPSPSLKDITQRIYGSVTAIAHPAGFWGALNAYRRAVLLSLPWSPGQYEILLNACTQIIEETTPQEILNECFMWPAHDATRSKEYRTIIVTPLGVKEILGEYFGPKVLWTCPAIATGHTYPMTTFEILKNIFLSIMCILIISMSLNYRGVAKRRKELGFKTATGPLGLYDKNDLYVSPHLPEVDFPGLDRIPKNVVCCGPIVLPTLPDQDGPGKELVDWVRAKPTVIICLGSHFTGSRASTLAMADALKAVLIVRKDIQVLWKVQYDWNSDIEMKTLLQDLLATERFRIEKWLAADPVKLLETGNVMCSVHHGGANSFFEACRYSVPHLVMPCWLDTYEWAERARLHGIGLIGNVGCAPGIEKEQFQMKLLAVLNDGSFQSRASEIGRIVSERGEGREIAAAAVLKWLESGEDRSMYR